MSGWAEARSVGVALGPFSGATPGGLHGAWMPATLAPGGGSAEAPTGVVFSPYRQYAPFVMIVVGAIVVGSVLLGLRKARRQPQMPPLEERLARLAEQKRAEREAGAGVVGGGAISAGGRGEAGEAHEGGASPSLRLAGGSGGGDAQRALEDLAKDAEELAERLAVAMDARAARLEGLIREADMKIRRLEEIRGREGSLAGPREAVARVGGRGEQRSEGRPAVGSEIGGQGREAGLAGGGVSGGAGGGGGRPVASLDDEADPVQREVFALADGGMAAVEIARRVNQPTGQVELMLALRGR